MYQNIKTPAYLIELGMMHQICSNEGHCSGVGNIEIAKICQQ